MTTVSKPVPGLPAANVAALPKNPGGNPVSVVDPQPLSDPDSLSRISSHSLSENLKSTGGMLNVTGQFHAMQLVSAESREEILRGPMPGFAQSVFRSEPAKVTAPPQRSAAARVWDAFANSVKGVFRALGQRLMGAAPAPAAQATAQTRRADASPVNLSLPEKFRIIRSDTGEGGLWGQFFKHCEKEHSEENITALAATQAALAAATDKGRISKDVFVAMTDSLWTQGTQKKAGMMCVNLPSGLQVRIADALDDFDPAAACGLVNEAGLEIEQLLQADTMVRFLAGLPDADAVLARAKQTSLA
ncbi:MAG: hypothetical protein AB7P37_04805 [Ramlibacter sp.]